jgi:ATP-dependent helicase/nuclease subunit A
MQFLESLQDEEREMGEASVLSEAEDAVRVMSIHRSKGLEFPVVIIPDLGKRHNLQDTRGPILVDRQAGLGLMAVNEGLRIRYPSAASVLVEERIRRQSLAEELRVLYVAMTRAREHLILVATCREDRRQKWHQQWARHEGAFPAEDILRSGCMLDWIGPVAAATAHHAPAPFQVSVYGSEDMRQYSQAAARKPALTEQQQRRARLEPLAPPPPDNPHAEHVKQQLSFIYPHRALTTLAAARTVGSLAKSSDSAAIGAISLSDDGPLPLPRSAAGSARATAAEIGAATHLVLQHLDFSRSCTLDDLRSQLQHLIVRRYIAPEQAQTVDLEAIAWFVQTPLGDLMRRHSRDLLRELSIYFPHWETPATGEPLDQVMVRGRIDVLIRDPGGIVVVDYKTDRITKSMLTQRTELYRPQVEAYSRAIGGILGEAVGSVELVFLGPREIVSLKP